MAVPAGGLSEPLKKGEGEKNDMELGKVDDKASKKLNKSGSTSFQPATKVATPAGPAYVIRCMAKLTTYFWFSDDFWTKAKAWVLLIIMFSGVILGVFVLLAISEVNAAMGDALVQRNSEIYYSSVVAMIVLLMGDTCVPIMVHGTAGTISKEWRKAMSRILFSDYISPGSAFFHMRSQDNSVDNPDQRVCQDCMEFADRFGTMAAEYTFAILVLVVFSYRTYTVHPTLGPELLQWQFLFYGVFTFVSLAILGPITIRITRLILGEEANLRALLIRIRENAEPVAFYRGYNYELERVFDVFRSCLILRYKAMLCILGQQFVSQLGGSFPWVILHYTVGEAIVQGQVSFGMYPRAEFLFRMTLTQLSSFLHSITLLGVLIAQAVRTEQLFVVLDYVNSGKDVNGVPPEDRSMIYLEDLDANEDDVVICVTNVTFLPPGFPRPTVENLNMTLRKGDSCLLAGASGIGKSSVLRCIAGLWSDGVGSIQRCPLDDCFMLPQEAYLCLGTLRSNIIYPELELPNDMSGRFTDMAIEVALEEANLTKVLTFGFKLDDEVDLKGILSGGERQRLSFARLILRDAMKLTILDEATSALDLANEEKMYRRMMSKSDCFLSVGHRPTLDRFHTHRLLLEHQGDDRGASGRYEKLDPDNLPSAQLAKEMAARGEA